MTEHQHPSHSPERIEPSDSLIDRLTDPTPLRELKDRHQALVDAFSDTEAIHTREEALIAQLRRLEDFDSPEAVEIKQELAALDHGLSHERHYAATCLAEMEHNHDQYWDTIGSTESQALQEHFMQPAEVQPFVDPATFISQMDREGVSIRLMPDDSKGLMIPLSNIVSAYDFVSWDGRQEGKGKDGLHGSRHVIDKYAVLPPETAPGVELEGVEQADGTIVYVVRDGGHRVAAARVRGDATVQASYLAIYKAKQ